MEHIKNVINDFLKKENQQNVLVLKGDWGVGKTYFWDNYIQQKIKSGKLEQFGYSYISLFGMQSLSEVRKSIFHKAKLIGSHESNNKLLDFFSKKDKNILDKFNKTIQKNAPMFSLLSSHIKNIPATSKYSDIMSIIEYNLIDNYIICFDDLERKGSNFSIVDIMGLIDELSTRKNCKVILIYNDASIEKEELSIFNKYREKIVDIELNFNPSSLSVLSYGIDSKLKYFDFIKNQSLKLNIKNIRVLKKIEFTIRSFLNAIKDNHDNRLYQELITHIIFHNYFYYQKSDILDYQEFIEKVNSLPSVPLVIKNKENDPKDTSFRSVAIDLEIKQSRFDTDIAFFIMNGFIDKESLTNNVVKYNSSLENIDFSNDLNEIWNLFKNSLCEQTKFSQAIDKFLQNYVHKIRECDFVSLVSFLGKDDNFNEKDIRHYVELFLEENQSSVSLSNKAFFEKYSSDIKTTKSINQKDYTIDDITSYIMNKHSWNDDMIEYLLSLTENDYIQWIRSEPNDLVDKIRGGLLIFRDFDKKGTTNNQSYKSLSTTIEKVLKSIGSENELNKQRVEGIFGIQIESDKSS